MKGKSRHLNHYIQYIFGMLILVITVMSTAVQLLSITQVIEDNAEQYIEVRADVGEETFTAWLNEKKLLVEFIVEDMLIYQTYDNIKSVEQYLIGKGQGKDQISEIYFATPEKQIVTSTGWIPGADFDPTAREWYIGASQTDEVYISKPYIDAVSNNVVIAISQRVMDGNNFVGIVGLDVSLDTLVREIELLSDDKGGYLFITNDQKEIIVHPNPEFAPINGQMQTIDSVGGKFDEALSKEDQVVISTTANGNKVYSLMDSLEGTDWKLISTYPTRYTTQALVQEVIKSAILLVISIAMGGFVIAAFTKKFIKPIDGVVEALQQVENGHLDIDVTNIPRNSYELNTLVESTDRISKVLTSYIDEIADILQHFGDGDFTQTLKQEYIGDFKTINTSIHKIAESLKETLVSINGSAEQVNAGAANIASAAENLAASAIEQTDLLSDFTRNTTEITNNIIDNMDEIDRSYNMVQNTITKATEGKEIMKEMIESMYAINESTGKISEVSKIIDDIANQTNLLALNAAIESARAGESGKGFAVVANEVRDLANRSSEIVKEIHAMVETSLETVKQGEEMAQRTSSALDSIANAINENAQISQLVKENSIQQREYLDEIVKDTQRLATVIEQNTAISEENVATSQELAVQAEELKNQMNKFSI